ncbi:MAG TPA: VanZ family protein [Feifaniaceae bacterium]|nr:VanZ family protein [Feifaniaceae bacterium]
MKKLMRVLLYVTFACYCIVIVYLLFLNREYRFAQSGMTLQEYMRTAVNLVPFRTIAELVTRTAQRTINPDIVFDNAIGNLLLFFPMGIYMPTVRRGTRKLGKFLKKMLLIVFVLESLQLLLRVGSFDVDDILLNVAGAAAGYGIWKTGAVQRVLRVMQWLK